MTQLEALKNVVESIDNKVLQVIFLGDWLEDINFHKEAAEVRGWLSPVQNAWYEELHKLHIARRENMYSATHYEGLKNDGYTSDIHEKAVQCMRERSNAVAFVNHYAFSESDLFNIKLVSDMVRGLNYIWGWGVENDLYTNKTEFLNTLRGLVGGDE